MQQPDAGSTAGPKACATCRQAHVSCDRGLPCGRCVRVGKADTCQPPPTRKRGRPRKIPTATSSSPHDDQPQPQQQRAQLGTSLDHDHHHHQHQPPPHAIAAATAAAAGKRVCVRPEATRPVVDPPGANRQPRALPAPAPAAGPRCCSSSSPSPASSSSPSSSSSSQHRSSLSPPPEAAEEYASSPWSSSPSSSPPWQPAAGFEAWALPASQEGQPGQEQDSQGLRSLLGLVVDQVREMRRENKRLHDTITQMRAAQSATERLLEQTRTELHQTRTELSKKIDDHVLTAHASPPRQCDSHTQLTAQPDTCAGLPAEMAVTEATTPGADVERFIAQTLPFLSAPDRSALILRDLQRPFMIMRLAEAETLDDVDTPTCEMLGAPATWFGGPDAEYLPAFVREVLTRPPTAVGQPSTVTGRFVTKQGRSVRVATQHQTLYNQRRVADWHITLVDGLLGERPQAVTHNFGVYNPARLRPLREAIREPTIRAYLLACLPHSLLFGRRGGGGELALWRPPFPAASRSDATAPEREDGELEALVRALDLPIQLSGTGGACLPLLFDHHGHHRATDRVFDTAPAPASLAERWIR